MNTVIEKKIRQLNCKKVNQCKKQKQNEVVLLKNKNETSNIYDKKIKVDK